MASTYSNLKVQLMTTGENSTTWGDVTNVNLGTALEEAIVGSADVTFASANQTLSLSDTNASQTARNMRLNCIGTTGGSSRNLVVPSIEKPYIVKNGCADSIVVKTSAGTGITVPAGTTMWVYSDGTNVVDVTTHLSTLTLSTVLPLGSGGTGSNTAAGARTSIGAAASGANTDITSLSPTSGLQVGAPTGGARGAGTVNATGLFVNGVAVGTGSGSVTSVNASGGSTGLTFSGGPITTSGTLTLSGILVVANGGTGSNTASGARTNLGLGTMATQNSSAVSITGGSISGLSSAIPVASGGTGVNSTPTNGQLLIGNGSAFSLATLTQGSGISVTNSAGGITIAATNSMVFPGAGIAVSTGSAWGTSLTAPSGTIVGTTDTQTLTNKRIDPRVSTNANPSSLTPTIASFDMYVVTGQAQTLTINAPNGTPVVGDKLMFRIKDSGSAQTLSWNAIFQAVGVVIPTTTVAGKTTYVGCVYNATDTKWDVIAVATQV